MSNMSDTKEPVQHEDSNVNDDIIDVWAMDFSDPDTWLLQTSQKITDDSIWDSCPWLSKKIEQECNNSQDSKRLIDTRTFTRPKKRSGRLSFESIGETDVPRPSNVWNPQILENIGTKETYNDDAGIAPSQREHVPCMLRLSMAGASNRFVQTPFASGHRSLEAIRCISRSNEIDTFVDLAKTESNEDIMQVSQPSVFYSSIMSVTTDDLSEGIDEISDVSRQPGIEDSQILTESMMEMSMFGDIYDVNFNDTFAKTSPNLPVLENITYCNPSLNTTFFDGTVITSKETLDSTFNTITVDGEAISGDATLLNIPNTEPQNYTFNVHKFDATFDKTSSHSSSTKSSTDFAPKESVPLNDPPMMMDERFINETFVAPCNQICDKLTENIDLVNPDETLRMNATFDKRPVLSPTKSSNDYAPKESPSSKVPPKVAENIDPVSRGVSLESFDTTFRKPSPKVQHKLKSPNQLSRLPQLLQKSNPNLGSNSLKLSNTTMRSGVSIFGFNKAVQLSAARNVESSLTTKRWHALEKTKSSSEQRLDVTINSTELQVMGSSESTESIASTRSTHSGPEFDDGLSVRSDGSNTSYSMRTMNIDKFQKMIRVREGCMMKQESTPKPCRGVLENNWVTTNDLPSPILKNSPETYDSRCSSSGSIDLAVKTSSPLLSSTQSLQNLSQVYVKSNKNHIEDTKITQNKIVAPRKISQAAVNQTRNTNQYKTGIRPPSNWSWTDRPASGIPRPRSRISAPTLIRPNTKINEGANKK